MEHKKTAATGSRFLDPQASDKSKAAMPRKPRMVAADQRKPTGFSAAAQTPRHKPASKPQPSAAEPQPDKKARVKKEKVRRESTDREKKPHRLRNALLILMIAAVIALALIMIFGNRGTYHMMPTVQRISEASFAPDQTPLPGEVTP